MAFITTFNNISVLSWQSVLLVEESRVNHHNLYTCILSRGCRGCDRMVVGITTTYAISAYHHKICKFESRSWQGVLDTTLHDKVCQ
jgi:hypothetical protein